MLLRRYCVALFVLASAMACSPLPLPSNPAPTPHIPSPPSTWRVDTVACAVAATVPYACHEPIAGATIQMHGPDGYLSQTADGAGYAVFTLPADFPDSDVIVSAPNFVTTGAHIDVLNTHDSTKHNIVVLPSTDVDPSRFTLSDLAAINGAMWPRANICADAPILPFGIRPNQPDNIIATTYFDNYTSQQQEDIARCLKSVGKTHVVVGGLVDWWAYHGQYSGHDYSTDAGFEKFLDLHQWFYNHGLKPVTFIHQDGATLADTQTMMRRLVAAHPRARQLIRIVVMSGWEPAKYEWSSCTWAGYVALGRELFPNALHLIHTVSDVDAPVGTDALCNDDDHVWNPGGNGAGWARVISAGLHGWLIQNGPYPGGPDGSRQTAEFAAQFKVDGDGATYHGAAWHFAGNAGWPTFSAWGQNTPICLYNAEATAYEAYWSNRPSEADRAAWGNLAVQSGACGALDGVSVPVPIRR